MKINVKFTSAALAATLLAGCVALTIPGESKTTVATRNAVVNGIRQLEKHAYQCAPSNIAIKDTRFVTASMEETTEKWLVSSCAGNEHSYMVSYQPEKSEAILFHEEAEKSGKSSELLWFTPGYKKIIIAKEIINEFDQEIDAARLSVLNESPETEAILQNGKGEQYGGKHWLSLCGTTNLKFKAKRIGLTMQTGKAMQPGNLFESTHCYKWYGTRRDWKETVLKKGCLGGCK